MNQFFIFLSILFLGAVSCTKTEVSVDQSNYASVSIYAVAPNAPDFNFFLNGNNVAVSVPFGSYTLYNKIPAGDVMFRGQSAPQNISTDTSFTTSAKQYYSVFLTGTSPVLHAIALHDSLPSVAEDSFGVRFFVFSPGVSSYNFHLVDTTSGSIKNIGWANRSYSDNIANDSINTFKRFAVGTYSLYVVGKTNKDTLARFTNRTFSGSSNYTLMLEGHFASGDTSLMLGTRLHQ